MCLVIFRDSRKLAYGHNGKLRSEIRHVEKIENTLATYTTALNVTRTDPLKQSIHDVPERAWTSADDDVDIQTELQNKV